MRATTPHRTGRSGRLWVVGACVVAAGVFGMHALNTHGAGGHGSAHGAAELVETVAAVHVSPDMRHLHPAAARELLDTSRAVAVPPAAPTSAGGLVGMCLAVLAGAALMLLAAVRRRRRPVRLAREAWSGRGGAAPAGRDRDPPSLTTLSVCRC